MDCHFCKEQKQECLVYEYPDPQKLSNLTPRSVWYTPQQIGEMFGYTAKQILRLARDPASHVVYLDVEGRIFILICTFTRFMQNRQRKWEGDFEE